MHPTQPRPFTTDMNGRANTDMDGRANSARGLTAIDIRSVETALLLFELSAALLLFELGRFLIFALDILNIPIKVSLVGSRPGKYNAPFVCSSYKYRSSSRLDTHPQGYP